MSERSNSRDSRHGALVTPVISRSMETKSAARTWCRSSSKDESKFDFVTRFIEMEAAEEKKGRREEENRARVRVLENALKRHAFFIIVPSAFEQLF